MSTSTDLVLEMLRQQIKPAAPPPELEVSESTWDQFEAAQRALDEPRAEADRARNAALPPA